MKLFCRQLGRGEPVIILHGLFGMSDNWLSVGRRLAGKYHVLLPDQRNHGRSSNTAEFNYKLLADDLDGLIKEKRLSDVRLIGHSMGGKVAMLYALTFPEKIKKLVVVDISPKRHARPYFKAFLEQMLKLNLPRLKTYREADAFLSQSINIPLVRQFLLKNLYKDENADFKWRINAQALYENVDEILRAIDLEKQFSKPALFVRGGKSDYIPEEDFADIKRMFPAAKIATIAESGHWVHSQAPDELCALLNEFL